MTRLSALVALLALAACSRTGVVLTVSGQLLAPDQLRITARFDGQSVARTLPDVPAGAIALPTDLFAELPPRALQVAFTVEALAAGQPIARAELSPLSLDAHQVVRAEAALTPLAPSSSPPPPPPDPTDAGPPPPGYSQVVLADHPLAYYRLDEPSGTTAVDSSGNGLNGSWGARVAHGAASALGSDPDAAAGFPGGSYSLDGLILVPPSPFLEPSRSLSVELWMRPSLPSPDFSILVDYGDDGYVVPWGLLVYQQAFGVYLETDSGSGGGRDFLSVTRSAAGTAYHLVQTWDGVAMRLYVNGVLEVMRPVGGSLAYGPGHAGLGIGGFVVGSDGDVIFAGSIDEVAVYAAALTPQQVLAHYDAGR